MRPQGSRYVGVMKARTIPLLTSILLALSLILGGAERGIAKTDLMTATAELTRLVICADGGTTTILIDAAGNPVDPDQKCQRHHCAECLGSASGTLPTVSVDRFTPVAGTNRCRQTDPIWSLTFLQGHAFARGPPLCESQIA